MSTSRKRARPASPTIRSQVSHHESAQTNEHKRTRPAQATQVNTHVHVTIDTSQDDRRHRPSVRTSHVARPAEVVDLSGLLVDEGDDSEMVDADFDTLPAEDASNLAFGVDDEIYEGPRESQPEEEEEESEENSGQVQKSNERVSFHHSYTSYLVLMRNSCALYKSGFPLDNLTWTSSSVPKA